MPLLLLRGCWSQASTGLEVEERCRAEPDSQPCGDVLHVVPALKGVAQITAGVWAAAQPTSNQAVCSFEMLFVKKQCAAKRTQPNFKKVQSDSLVGNESLAADGQGAAERQHAQQLLQRLRSAAAAEALQPAKHPEGEEAETCASPAGMTWMGRCSVRGQFDAEHTILD